MRWLSHILSLVLVTLLAACGGGGGSGGNSLFGSGAATGGDSGATTSPTVSLSLSAATTSTASPVVAIATVLSKSGAPVSGALVRFSAGANGSVSDASVSTNAAGQATTTLYPAIGVSSGAGQLTAIATVDTVDYTATKAFSIAASSTQGGVTLALSSSSVSSAPAVTVTATVRNVSGSALSGQVVSFSTNSAIGSLSASTAMTDSTGTATVTLSATPGVNAGADYVTATTSIDGASVQTSRGYQVVASGSSGSGLRVALSSTTVSAAAPGTVSATVTNSAGGPQANQLVSFTTSGGFGALSAPTALTNTSGIATITVSPAVGAPTGAADLIIATTTLSSLAFRAETPFQIGGTAVASTPSITIALSNSTVSSIAPATVTATLRDGSSNPIAGKVLSFATQAGLGTLSATSGLTDSTGSVQVLLSPKAGLTSGADYVTVTASVSGSSVSQQQGFQIGGASVGISSVTTGLSTGASLSAYGQTNISVVLSNVASGTPVTLAVGSSCVDKGKASFLPATTTTTSGAATFTYRDIGCGATTSSDDLKITIAGTSVTQSLALALSAPAAANIQFSSATPETIYLRGSGFTESSTVVFQVTDLSGNPLPEQQVELCLTSLVGGLTVDGQSGMDCSGSGASKKVLVRTSNSEGKVSALINSGTVPTPVRVRAALVGKTINTVSSNLAVAVGLPSQLNFSLSQGTRNIEGMNIDGTTNTYSIIASDRMGNPVPAGTAISFVTEGGQVEASKQIAIVSGIARTSANFVSSEPRPRDGRVTIVSYALGEESFLDLNGNNVFDTGEDFFDLGDIFKDRAYNGRWDTAEDEYVSLSISDASTCRLPTNAALLGAPNQASVPSRESTCNGEWGRAYVRRAIETVLSTSEARPVWSGQPAIACPISGLRLQNGPVPFPTASATPPSALYYPLAGADVFNVGKTGSVSFIVADANTFPGTVTTGTPVGRLNPMAAGTTITVASSSDDLDATFVGGSPVPSTTEVTGATFSYKFKDSAPADAVGVVNVKFTSPSGLITSVPVTLHRSTYTCP